MEEHVIDTGDTGRLKIEDHDGNVELFAQSLSPVSIPQLPWRYAINGSAVSWKSFNFTDTTMWQRLGGVYVGTSETFTLYLGNTGTSQMGGPTELTINLVGYVPTEGTTTGIVSIKVGTQYKKATPYVKVNGVWKIATPFVHGERGWTQL